MKQFFITFNLNGVPHFTKCFAGISLANTLADLYFSSQKWKISNVTVKGI